MRHRELGKLPLRRWSQGVVVSPSAASSFVRASGQLRHIRRNASGVTFTCLFFASVEEGSTFVKIGMTSSAITATCKPIASTWLQPKFSSFDHISFTFTGFTAKGSGACFGGEKNSLMRVPKPPKFDPQATASLLFTGSLGAGPELKKSFRLSPTPVPKVV